jgi:hypothetical protein
MAVAATADVALHLAGSVGSKRPGERISLDADVPGIFD